jgi:flagellar basal body rod protein FlgG
MLMLGLAAGTFIPVGMRWLGGRYARNSVIEHSTSAVVDGVLQDTEAETAAVISTSGPPLRLASASSTAPAQSFENHSVSADADRSAIFGIIRSVFPDADDETVNVWAETFSGMSAVEIRDVLEQKRAISGSLDSIFTPGLRPLTDPPGIAEQALAVMSSSRDAERQASEINLRNAWTVGYRRRLVLPAVQAADENTGTVGGQDFIDFSPGRVLQSPYSLHAAITGDALQMFLLEGGQVTRRGDFVRLSDGRVGIRTATGERALEDSPVTEANARLRILEHGELQCSLSTGQWTGCGRAAVVEVLRPDLLKTTDGVLFEAKNPSEVWTLVSSGAVYLQPGRVEISNVDASEELLRLEALDRSNGISVPTSP